MLVRNVNILELFNFLSEHMIERSKIHCVHVEVLTHLKTKPEKRTVYSNLSMFSVIRRFSRGDKSDSFCLM